jgi:tetratricopeptide (TPR) repeat protein
VRLTLLVVVVVTLTAPPLFAQGFCHPVGFGPRWWGPPVAPAWGWGWWGPPVTVLPPPVVFVPPPAFGFDLVEPLAASRAEDDDRWATMRVDAAVKRGDLLVVEPNGTGIKLAAVKPAPAAGRAGGVNPLVPPTNPDPPTAPAELAAFHVGRAKQAFEAGELGRATERLQAAVAAKPDLPRPHFLLAQVWTARGRYADAMTAIRDGLKLDPNWPGGEFTPAELYGTGVGRMATDWADLRAALAASPDDPTLVFLVGYHRWWTGERAEAVELFRRVKAAAKDAEVVEPFLGRK